MTATYYSQNRRIQIGTDKWQIKNSSNKSYIGIKYIIFYDFLADYKNTKIHWTEKIILKMK